jgi:hypothetical protein
VSEAIAEADRVDHRVEPRPVHASARDVEREGDVLGGRERGDEIVGLEDEPDALPPQQRKPPLVQRGEVDVADEDPPGGRPVEARQAVQECGLARTGRTHDRGEPARLEVECDASEGLDGGLSLAVDLP